MAIKFSNTFLLRKLHQITGIVPLGVFFFVHMFTNSKAMNGEASFNKAVKEIHDIPYLLLIEIFGIFLPLLFHSVYGVIISSESKPNPLSYGYGTQLVLHLPAYHRDFSVLFLAVSHPEFTFRNDPGSQYDTGCGQRRQSIFDCRGRISDHVGAHTLYCLESLRRRGIWRTDSFCSPSIGAS